MLPADPERALALAYAPAAARAALALLWGIDERLGQIVAATREERIGAIRLAWWREALERLDTALPPEEPLLREAADKLLPRGVSGAALGGVADGWAALLAAPLDDAALGDYAAERGARLFALAGVLLGPPSPLLPPAGEGWALVDLAFHLRDPVVVARALALARLRLETVARARWPARLRSLGALAVLAAEDAARGDRAVRRPGSPGRVLRMLRHQLNGR